MLIGATGVFFLRFALAFMRLVPFADRLLGLRSHAVRLDRATHDPLHALRVDAVGAHAGFAVCVFCAHTDAELVPSPAHECKHEFVGRLVGSEHDAPRTVEPGFFVLA